MSPGTLFAVLWRSIALLASALVVVSCSFIAFLANVEENCNNGVKRFLCSDFADHVAPLLAVVSLVVLVCLALSSAFAWARRRDRSSR